MADENPNWGHYLGYGLQMAVGVILGVVVGMWIDRKLANATPWGTIIGAMLGMAAGMYMLIKDAIRMNKQ